MHTSSAIPAATGSEKTWGEWEGEGEGQGRRARSDGLGEDRVDGALALALAPTLALALALTGLTERIVARPVSACRRMMVSNS